MVGELEEKLSEYAGGLILFLQDSGQSYKNFLQIIDVFSMYSRLRVNWSKCQILPVDPNVKYRADPDLSLTHTSKFKYLGIHMYMILYTHLLSAESYFPNLTD